MQINLFASYLQIDLQELIKAHPSFAVLETNWFLVEQIPWKILEFVSLQMWYIQAAKDNLQTKVLESVSTPMQPSPSHVICKP